MARLFNAYVIVDWSAAESKTTGKNSIWIGVVKRDVRFRFAFESHNPATRREAETLIAQILDDRAKHRERTLIGFDFAFGYPRGFAEALKLPGDAPWRAVWDLLARRKSPTRPDNMNNRFQVGAKLNRLFTGGPFPFWGCTPKYAQTTIQPTKSRLHGPGDLPELRHTEMATLAKGASPVWKLGYPGSVGGQTLVGIPAVKSLEGRARRPVEGMAVRDRLEGADGTGPGGRRGCGRRGLSLDAEAGRCRRRSPRPDPGSRPGRILRQTG